MLVLTRKHGQLIEIGDSITIEVLGVAGGYVRLGIDAPNHVRISRPDAVNQTPRDRVLDAAQLGRLAALEDEMDHEENCRPSEADMITPPRAKAMARQLETLQNALEHLREENASLRAKIQNREHVE